MSRALTQAFMTRLATPNTRPGCCSRYDKLFRRFLGLFTKGKGIDLDPFDQVVPQG